MRIGIDARMLGSAFGIGRYIDELSRRIFDLDQENEYIIFLREPVFSSYRPPSSRVRKVLAPEPWYGFREQIFWPRRVRREKPDLLFVPQFNVPLLVPCPFIVTIHDVTQLYVPGALQKRSFVHRAAFRFVFQRAAQKARAVIAVSHYTKEEIIKNFHVKPEKIHVIYEGAGLLPKIDPPEAWFDGGVVGNEPTSSRANEPYILAVGVWRPHKNFDGLLEAFALLKKNSRFADVRLVLAGEEDPRYSKVRESIAALGLSEYVVAPGIPDDRSLDQLYRGARLVVIPSFFEGFGFIGLEALSRNVPVASSNTTALPEILGDAALYFDPRNSEEMARVLEKLLTDNNERQRLLRAAPGVLARYSWEKAAKETLQLLLAFGK